MKWTVALSGLGLSILTVRGMYDLSSEEAPSTS
jgi:hypothetical protein